MKTATDIFKKFLDEKIGNQISIIDEICKQTDLDTQKWFNFFKSEFGIYSGDEFLDSILDNFSVYLTQKFEQNFVKYIEPNGYSLYNNPYYSIFINILDLSNATNDQIDFELNFDDIDELEKIIIKLTLSQKEELMKNKLFSYVINQTNFEFYSKNDIRALKLKNLDECL